MSDASVLIIEDRSALLTRLSRAVDSAAGMRVVGSATTLAGGIDALIALRPRIVLVDLGLPDGSGIEAVRAAAAADWQCESLVISIFGDEERVVAAIRAGAAGYLLKGGSADEVTEGIRSVLEGNSPISPAIARHLLGLVQRELTQPDADPAMALTTREYEILDQVARGYKRREIAQRLGISTGTVGNHIHNIYRKLDVASNTQAVSRATRLGLL